MIWENFVSWLCNKIDGTDDNDKLDDNEELKVKLWERVKIKQLRRR